MTQDLKTVFENSLATANAGAKLPAQGRTAADMIMSSTVNTAALSANGDQTTMGVNLNAGVGSALVNNVIQFAIDASNERLPTYLRIGGIFGFDENWILCPDMFARPGCDSSANVSDQWGPKVPFAQVFSKLTSSRNILIEKVEVLCDDTPQLNNPFTLQRIQKDGTIIPTVKTVVSTFQMSDNRKNFAVLNASEIISESKWLEYRINAGVTATVLVTLQGSADTGIFSAYNG